MGHDCWDVPQWSKSLADDLRLKASGQQEGLCQLLSRSQTWKLGRQSIGFAENLPTPALKEQQARAMPKFSYGVVDFVEVALQSESL